MPPGATPIDRARSWEPQFRKMDHDWRECLARWRKALLTDWCLDMDEMRRQHDRLVAEGLWVTGASDFLGIIGQARHENTHSLILKWLLYPKGRHGLGLALVRQLVEHCAEDTVPHARAVRDVAFSHWRNGREADIVVWGDDFTLVIENKVDADEQPRQCDDLHSNFRHDETPLFLFLTPDGRKPSTATEPAAQRAFRTLSWRALRTMIETAMGESLPAPGPANGVDVVGNYLRTLKEHFG